MLGKFRGFLNFCESNDGVRTRARVWGRNFGWVFAWCFVMAGVLLQPAVAEDSNSCEGPVRSRVVSVDDSAAFFRRDALGRPRKIQLRLWAPPIGCASGTVAARSVVILSDAQAEPSPGLARLARTLARQGISSVTVGWNLPDPESSRRYCALFGVDSSSCEPENSGIHELPLDIQAVLRDLDRRVLPLFPKDRELIGQGIRVGLVTLGPVASRAGLALAGAGLQSSSGREQRSLRGLDGVVRLSLLMAVDPPGLQEGEAPSRFPRFLSDSWRDLLAGAIVVVGDEDPSRIRLFEGSSGPSRLLIRVAEAGSAHLALSPSSCMKLPHDVQLCDRWESVLMRVVRARLLGESESQAFLASGSRGEIGLTSGAPEFVTSQEAIPAKQVKAGTLFRWKLSAVTPDPVPLQFACAECPAGMQVGSESGEVSWAPNAAQTGPIDFEISVSDGILHARRKGSLLVDPSECGASAVVTLSKPRSGIPGDPRNFRVSVHNPNPAGRCSPLRVRVQVEPPPGWDLGMSQRSFEVRPESRREVTLTLTPPELSPRDTTQNFSVRIRHEDELVRPDSAVQGSYRIR
jgi:hypothetical protein